MIVEINDDDYERKFDYDDYPSEITIIRDKLSEDIMIQLLAAETIQTAYKRYISCKAAKKMKRVKSTDLLVKNMAAETIIKGIKNKILNKNKVKIMKQNEDKDSYLISEDKVSSNFDNSDNEIKNMKQIKSIDDNNNKYQSTLNINDSAPKSNRYDEYYDSKDSKESKESKESAPEVNKPPVFPLDIKFDNENKRSNKKKVTRMKGSNKLKRQDKQTENNNNNNNNNDIDNNNLESKEVIKEEVNIPSNIDTNNSNHDNNSLLYSERERPKISSSIDLPSKISSIHNEVYVNKFSPPVTFIESSTDRYRVIDEAFSQSLNFQCSIVALQTHEIAMVLDALGCELLYSVNELKNKSIELIEVPVLSTAPLAAVLSFHGKSKRLVKDYDNFVVSEQMANIAVKHLSTLVCGPWLKARTFLLKYFNLSKDKIVRPALWPIHWIHEFAKILQFPEKHFTLLTGKAFLEIPKSFLKEVYGILPSLLQARFMLYQHLFSLLDQWWDKGIRPNDIYKEKESSKKTTKSSRKQESLKIIKESENWGKFEGKYSLQYNNDEKTLDKVNIEICHFQMLLDSLVPLNRAYGWGIQLDRLTLICGKVSDLKGYIKIQNISDQDVKGCRWVTLHTPLQLNDFESFPETLCMKTREGGSEKDRILVPISCMRPIVSNQINIKPNDIKVGSIVKVVSEQDLRQSLERYDWWDRPSTKMQSSILGLIGEVVSISELTSNQRVGVRFHGEAIDIVDAIPVDAIVLVNDFDDSIKSGIQKLEKKKKETKKSKKKVLSHPSSDTNQEVVESDKVKQVTAALNKSPPLVPQLPLENLSSSSPMTVKVFSKADKLFRAVESLDFCGRQNESKEEDFTLSHRSTRAADDDKVIKSNDSNDNGRKQNRPSTAKERRLYRPLPSEEPITVPAPVPISISMTKEELAKEKQWLFEEDNDNVINDDIDEDVESIRYSWMKSVEILPRSASPIEKKDNDTISPRPIKVAKLSIYEPKFTEDDYHVVSSSPKSPGKSRPKSAPTNKRDNNEKNKDRVGPRIYNKMIHHDDDYEPDQLPQNVMFNHIGVAGRNIKKLIDKDLQYDDLIAQSPDPFIPEPPKFKYMPKTKINDVISRSKDGPIVDLLIEPDQIGVLGYAYGKDIPAPVLDNNDKEKGKEKPLRPKSAPNKRMDEQNLPPSKNNEKSLGKYLIQQQFAGDFLDGQNLKLVANIAMGNKISDNIKSEKELLAIELEKNEKLFQKQDQINEKNLRLKNRKYL